MLFAIAAAARFAARPYASVLLALTSTAMVATGLTCLRYGLRSDVVGLPPIGRLSQRTSRVIYRLCIAAFHFLQPFARLYGRVRGAVSKPAWRRRRSSASPNARSTFAPGARVLFRRQAETAFWSESWIDVRDLLTFVADRLRRQRAFRYIELDSGWWEDRDLTIVSRLWFRIDIRALVEDHGNGRCLCRLRTRSRIMPAAMPLAFAIAAVLLLYATGAITRPLGMLVFVGLIGAIALGEMLMACGLVSNTVDSVAADFHTFPVEPDHRPRGRYEPARNAEDTYVSRELAGKA